MDGLSLLKLLFSRNYLLVAVCNGLCGTFTRREKKRQIARMRDQAVKKRLSVICECVNSCFSATESCVKSQIIAHDFVNSVFKLRLPLIFANALSVVFRG